MRIRAGGLYSFIVSADLASEILRAIVSERVQPSSGIRDESIDSGGGGGEGGGGRGARGDSSSDRFIFSSPLQIHQRWRDL